MGFARPNIFRTLRGLGLGVRKETIMTYAPERLDVEIAADVDALEYAYESAVVIAWRLGGKLLARKERIAYGEWADYLWRMRIRTRSAQNYMRLADKYAEPAHLRKSIDASLKAVATARVDDEAERRERDERLDARLDNCRDDVGAVDYLQGLLDKRDDEHKEHLREVKRLDADLQKEEKKLADLGADLKAGRDSDPKGAVDESLAKFFNVARKTA